MAVYSLNILESGQPNVATHDEATTRQPIDAMVRQLNAATGLTWTCALSSGTPMMPAGPGISPNAATRARALAIAAGLGLAPGAAVPPAGFTTTDLSSYGGGAAVSHDACRGWDGTQIRRAACIAVVPAATDLTPAGRICAQIVNAPGDSPTPPGSPNTRRTEFLDLRDASGNAIREAASADPVWYDWLWKFPTGYALPALASNPHNWAIVVQLHSDDRLGASPPFALNCGVLAAGGPVVYSVSLDGGDIANGQDFVRLRFLGNTTNATPGSAATGALRPECAGETPISPADAEKVDFDGWSRFNAGIRWATDDTGFVAIQRQNRATGEWQTVASKPNYPTLQWNSAMAGQTDGAGNPTPTPHYWKQGIYLGDHPDSGVGAVTATFRVGPFSRARTQAAVRAYGG